ncbi:MAG: mechanosensitive ion channel family protein [Planctomycetota bacterium]|jgi:small-conductance mechanosensitive channel
MPDFIKDFLDGLKEPVLGNALWEWALALGIALVVFVVMIAVKAGVVRLVRRRAEKTDNKLDDALADVFAKTSNLLLLFGGLYAGSQFLQFSDKIEALLRSLLVVAILVQGGLWANALLVYWIVRKVKAQEGDVSKSTAVVMFSFAGKLVIWSLVLLLSLDNLGVDVTALIAGLGVGGIAVALAVQNILGDLFASISIALDKPFEIGDFIIVGDFMGTVEYIGLKTTRLKSLSGEQIVMGNGDLLGSRIRNFKRMQERRIVFGLGVTYQTPIGKLEAIPGMVKAIIEEQEETRADRCHFKGFGAFSLDFEFVFYVTKPDYALYMDRQQAINLAIMRKFAEEGIEFAYPTQTLFVEKAAGGVP